MVKRDYRPHDIKPGKAGKGKAQSTANRTETVKPRGGSWKPGQSGNPAGRPCEGQSWSAVIKDVTDKTAGEVAEMVGAGSTLGRALSRQPKDVPLKTLIAVRLVVALLKGPNAGLARALFDAEETAELEKRIAQLEALNK